MITQLGQGFYVNFMFRNGFFSQMRIATARCLLLQGGNDIIFSGGDHMETKEIIFELRMKNKLSQDELAFHC